MLWFNVQKNITTDVWEMYDENVSAWVTIKNFQYDGAKFQASVDGKTWTDIKLPVIDANGHTTLYLSADNQSYLKYDHATTSVQLYSNNVLLKVDGNVITLPPTAQLDMDASSTFNFGVGKIPAFVGYAAQAQLYLGTLPTAADTVTIGADVYEFNGAGVNINVPITPLDLPATRLALVNAINTSGTEHVLATDDAINNLVNLCYAASPGTSPVFGPAASIALSSSLISGTDNWNQANINATGGIANHNFYADGWLTVTAENLLFPVRIGVPFTPSAVNMITTLSGTTATITSVVREIILDLAAGATPLTVGDVVFWKAWG